VKKMDVSICGIIYLDIENTVDMVKIPGNKQGHWGFQFLRFICSGCIVFILGMCQYNILYTIIPKMPYYASIIWLLNFLVGTVWVHAIHWRFTFTGTKHVSYLTSLFRTYLGYAGTQIGGGIIMLLLCDLGSLHHLVGWGFTTILTSVLNFIIMRSYSCLGDF
jgi:hypothetical protein